MREVRMTPFIIPMLKEEINLSTIELGRLKEETGKREAERRKLQQQLFEAEAIIKQLKSKEELTVKKAKLEQENQLFEEKEHKRCSRPKSACSHSAGRTLPSIEKRTG